MLLENYRQFFQLDQGIRSERPREKESGLKPDDPPLPLLSMSPASLI